MRDCILGLAVLVGWRCCAPCDKPVKPRQGGLAIIADWQTKLPNDLRKCYHCLACEPSSACRAQGDSTTTPSVDGKTRARRAQRHQDDNNNRRKTCVRRIPSSGQNSPATSRRPPRSVTSRPVPHIGNTLSSTSPTALLNLTLATSQGSLEAVHVSESRRRHGGP